MLGVKKSWAAFLLAFVLPLLAVFAWWGGFNRVQIRATHAGPYDFVYRDYAGSLADLPKTQAEVERALVTAGLTPGAAITILLDDPRQVGNDKVRARVGRLLDVPLAPSAKLPAELSMGRIEARAVLEARVHAAALLAPSKAYAALIEHLEAQGLTFTPPAVEIYRPREGRISVGDFSIEMEAPAP